eukprot:242278_1
MEHSFGIKSDPSARWNMMRSFSASCTWLDHYVIPIAMLSLVKPYAPSFKRVMSIVTVLSLLFSVHDIMNNLPDTRTFIIIYITLQCLLITARLLLFYYMYYQFDFPWNSIINEIQIEYQPNVNVTINLIKYSNLCYLMCIISYDCFCTFWEAIHAQDTATHIMMAMLCKHMMFLWPLYISVVIGNMICAKYDLYLHQLIQSVPNISNKYHLCFTSFNSDYHWSLRWCIIITVIVSPSLAILLMMDGSRYMSVITPFLLLIGWTIGCSDLYERLKNKVADDAALYSLVKKNAAVASICLEYRQSILFIYVVAGFATYILVLR